MRADMADKALTLLASCPSISNCPVVHLITQHTCALDVDTGQAVCCAGTGDVGSGDLGFRDVGICVVSTHTSAGADDEVCFARGHV